jgi:hypothetical protein
MRRPRFPPFTVLAAAWLPLTAILAGCGDDDSVVVWYVDDDAAAGGDGRSWATAFQHPQDAVDAASAGNEVWVAEGSYVRREATDEVVVTMKDSVAIYGGFAGTEAGRGDRDWEAHVTTLDGEDVCYHVLVGASNAALDGFTVTRGNARNTDSPPLTWKGGGLMNDSVSDILVANCVFTFNTANDQFGGATYSGSSSMTILDTAFLSNSAEKGGAVFADRSELELRRCEFDSNWASMAGGAMCLEADDTTVVESCSFSGNAADPDGASTGGAFRVTRGSADFDGCSFTDNRSSLGGGEALMALLQLTDCSFVGNSASVGGALALREEGVGGSQITRCRFVANVADMSAAISLTFSSSPRFENCVLAGNIARLSGGALRSSFSSPSLLGCTLTGNLASGQPGSAIDNHSGSVATVVNSIIWGNGGTAISNDDVDSSALLTHTCAQGGWDGVGNIDADPMFIDPGYWDDNGTPADTSDDFWVDGDYHPSASSPCIDTGDPATTLTEDIEGNPRPSGSGYDMGAYEHQQ